ncbi:MULTISPECIES: F0F1 ATP synthase subunit B [Mesonia]|uniref:ATP synthase subunit b n=1 Tax=Mesonia oceanica TaxID=2687242 RepID=A0AC61YBR1_9FLAO|nr:MULTISPECIES: F0F1 ATP synthase subunit B [Mesonia]MAN27022.1 ATP synthase F0 subunit B [Mesonia sp.]VVV01932.1 ATP synthase subunit b [Mesonia oceanica]|tara:strand:- start:49 stop:549 length:501 start_codon:yes stop_codon:yes gene_type:complete
MEKLVNDFAYGLFFWQALILIVLILLLRKYAWRPVLNSLDKREQGIKDALDSAEKARLEMKNLQANNEKMKKEAREERDELLKEARQIKEKMIADASGEAEEKANAMILKAQESIRTEKQAALSEIKAQVASLSIEIAEKVVKKELDNKEDQMRLVDNMLDDVKLN